MAAGGGTDLAGEGHRQPIGLLMSAAMRNHYLVIEKLLHDYGYRDLRHADTVVFENITPEGTRVSDIARRSMVTKQAVAQTVDYLEKLGYVERTADPTDARAKIVKLSRKGRRAAAVAKLLLIDMEEELTRSIGEARLECLRTALEHIAVMSPSERLSE